MKKELDFDVLAQIQLEEVLGSGVVGGRIAVTRNPVDADIKIFADGSCYPSVALIAEFNLEYGPVDGNQVENGFDIIETSKWGMWPKGINNLILISAVSKHSKKVDLFGKVTYDKSTGQPKASVKTQGASSFGQRLLVMLKEVYEVDVDDYVDIKILRDKKLPSTSNGIYNLPKLLVKGKDAGKYTTERRENIAIYPLDIVEKKAVDPEVIQNEAVSDISNLGRSHDDIPDKVPEVSDDDLISMGDEIMGTNKNGE